MNSIGENCNDLKKQYDSCFLTWFSEHFLKGQTNDDMWMEACRDLKEQYDNCFNTWFAEKFLRRDNNDEMCAPLLKLYRECVEKAMKENNIDLKEIEKNMLGSEEEQAKPPPKNS